MMKNRKWGDNDKYFGPFTYARDKYRNLSFILGSGNCEDSAGCYIRVAGFGHTLIISLPQIIMPYREKITASSWDDDTVKRMGRNWYWKYDEREYGFSYAGSGCIGDGGFLQVFLGRQTQDSSNEQRWSCFTPWNNWRHVRHIYYDLDGKLFTSEPQDYIDFTTKAGNDKCGAWKAVVDTCPTRTFSFRDFDGEALTAKTRAEECQWELGTGWFKWLSHFHKPIIRRSLDIDFSGETGKRKGSWEGGTVGHSIEMLPGELHESAFRRYCAEHEMTFFGYIN
jgi:hypothetical protein